MKLSVFDCKDFKVYLATRFSTVGASRGMRMTFAKMINASPSYVTKILTGKVRLNLEHVPILNKLLEHDEQESKFFMLLVLYTQAGSKDLENHFLTEIKTVLERRTAHSTWIKKRDVVPAADMAKFYSSWVYGVIYILTAIPQYQDKNSIAKRLRLSPITVKNALEYLVEIGLVEALGDSYKISKRRIHLDPDGEWTSQSHMNARQFAIQKLNDRDPENLHFSLNIAFSKKNFEDVKTKLRQLLIQEIEPLAVGAKNEDAYFLNLDFFRI